MRNLLLLFVILSLPGLKAQAQTYHPFADSGAVWSIYHQAYLGMPNSFSGNMVYYKQAGDTVIGSYTYQKIYEVYSNSIYQQYLGAIRHDSITKSIYYTGNFYGPVTDTLLYRFGLNVGDTLPDMYHISGSPILQIVTSIDSVLIGSQYRKKYTISRSDAPPEDEWIEGIGSTYYLFMPFDYEFEQHRTLLCYEENNQQLFQHSPGVVQNTPWTYTTAPAFPCYGNLVNVPEESVVSFSMMPNPATGELILTIDKSGETFASIVDITGKEIAAHALQQGANKIDLSGISNGVYFIKVFDQYGNHSVSRIMIAGH